MCDFSADATELNGDAFAQTCDTLAPLVAESIVKIEGRHITVTKSGRSFVRLVAAAFDAYLARGKARHSVAV